ncbi:exo-alpha-sialidase [Blastopirellula sp. J2-11]|uniref:exo-alpha-sialidase n=1 Tax=Blastopirellula sp. J2-11 TaxID=2943192 RepID=UPI0021C87B4F|nr:exo-alpha-sialidase [Blastopirellula sp. J2-11]UUO08663.1 exo-alpha-sialidase [Blastopirellula sp. J2-11]
MPIPFHQIALLGNKFCAVLLCLALLPAVSQAEELLIKSITVETPLNAPDDGTYWMQARPGKIPKRPGEPSADQPLEVITLQAIDGNGTHMYHGMSSMWSDDHGNSWQGPQQDPALDRRTMANGLIEVPVDMTPQWHAKSGKLLLTGATFWLDPKLKKHAPNGGSDIAYSAYDPRTHQWAPWKKVELPDSPQFHFARSGCSQRYDLPNGDILLPIYFGGAGNDSRHFAMVLRCQFDGKTLRVEEQGNALSIDIDRGFVEPSLTKFGETFFLTLRNDRGAYVTTSQDGLHFDKPKPWAFDDGQPLGSYNTQQHWVTHSDGLFLAYTRKGADNDDIFRHRAPLFIAQVDPQKLVVLRQTEQTLLPKLKDGFGNFGLSNISPEETWVVAGRSRAKSGEPSLYLSRIQWSKPNAAP